MKKNEGYTTLQPGELIQWVEERKDFVLIDTLPKEIYDKRRLPGASNACVYEVTFPDQVAALTRNKQREIFVRSASPAMSTPSVRFSITYSPASRRSPPQR